MANFYSNHMAALATPSTRAAQTLNVGEGHGRVRVKRIECTVPDTANNDTIGLARFRSTDRIIAMIVACDDLGTAGVIDIGLFRPTDTYDATAATSYYDVDAYVDGLALTAGFNAVSISTTRSTDTPMAPGIGFSPAKYGKTLWEVAGQSEDPGGYIDLVGTTVTGTTVAGCFVVVVEYVAGD
jgi:hypothetical protein